MTSLKNKQTMALFLSLFAVAFMAPDMAMATAGGANPLGTVLCNVVGWFTGPVGVGIATLAIIVIGIGALMGKVSWGMAIIVGIGVAIVFGAADIVALLAPTATAACAAGG